MVSAPATPRGSRDHLDPNDHASATFHETQSHSSCQLTTTPPDSNDRFSTEAALLEPEQWARQSPGHSSETFDDMPAGAREPAEGLMEDHGEADGSLTQLPQVAEHNAGGLQETASRNDNLEHRSEDVQGKRAFPRNCFLFSAAGIAIMKVRSGLYSRQNRNHCA